VNIFTKVVGAEADVAEAMVGVTRFWSLKLFNSVFNWLLIYHLFNIWLCLAKIAKQACFERFIHSTNISTTLIHFHCIVQLRPTTRHQIRNLIWYTLIIRLITKFLYHSLLSFNIRFKDFEFHSLFFITHCGLA